MRGAIRKRTLNDGAVRYDARWRAGGKIREKTFKRKRDAERYLVDTVKKVHEGSWQEVTPALMREVFVAWLEDLDTRVKLGEIKSSTAATYRGSVKVHFEPMFGDFRSDQFTARVIAAWRRTMAAKIETGDMAPKTYNNLLNLLHSILAWAREPAQGFLSHDPLVGVKRVKVRRPEAVFLEDDEISALLEAASGSPEDSAIIHVALFAGLRRGEVFGLQWDDLEVNGDGSGRIRVRRSVYQGKIMRPKTATSERIVDVPRPVLDALARHKEARRPIGEGFVFRTRSGAPLDPNSWYRRVFTSIRKRAKLENGVGLHSLRHTYASLLIRQGENPKYTSSQLGHSSTSFTMDTYGHLFETTSTRAMGRLDEAIRAAKRRRFDVVTGGA